MGKASYVNAQEILNSSGVGVFRQAAVLTAADYRLSKRFA